MSPSIPSEAALPHLLLVRCLLLAGGELVGIGCACPGQTEEQLAAVGERHIARVRSLFGVIPSLIAVHDDLRSLWKRVLICPPPEKRIGTSALDHPDLLGAIPLDDLHMNPCVGIHPFDLHDLAFE